jgi:hypothetical protein
LEQRRRTNLAESFAVIAGKFIEKRDGVSIVAEKFQMAKNKKH